ncbi:serine/threonine-protein kinase 17A-like [Vespula maculifrons]|uniref:Serine/threonine-protein kinase 17A-like n=1 Tax=Vespula maculifrons TaxID=7453 RepID=A0ABD2AXX0_VESMC
MEMSSFLIERLPGHELQCDPKLIPTHYRILRYPQNLVLTGDFPDCDVKLCDFGISRYISHGADIREILGTPDYVAGSKAARGDDDGDGGGDGGDVGIGIGIGSDGGGGGGGGSAPEVLNYEPISLATDMWSVGVLLYVLLTGCSPFGGDTKQETFCNISRCRLDFPDDLFEDVSEEARDLMRKLMVKDPSERLTVTECLKHAWFAMFDDPVPPLSSSLPPTEDSSLKCKTISQQEEEEQKQQHNNKSSTEETKTTIPPSAPKCCDAENTHVRTSSLANQNEVKTMTTRAVSSHTENIYSTSKSSPKSMRFGLSPDRRDTFKRNMESLAQKFSSTEIVIIESSCANSKNTTTSSTTITTSSTIMSGNVSTQRRATATHTMPAGEVFKCTPVFILGEEQQCSDGGSDTVSEISTDSSSDRSSIYSDDSLDFILYGKTQGGGRASFPFAVGADPTSDRWEQRHHHHHNPRAWPRECNGVVSKALSRFTSETSSKSSKLSTTVPPVVRGKTGLEALRERGGNLVVIREPVRAGRYTRYSEVQCESVQARIRRFQVHGAS